jgi:hypothetical protein
MDDEFDVARDEWISSLYDDFAKDVIAGRNDLYREVVEQFTSERLQSYYVSNSGVVQRAVWALDEARNLLTAHPEASIVCAVTAAEVGLKSGLLKPVLHGLVHDDAMAVIIADLVPDQRNNKFQSLLFGILREYGALDLSVFKRPGVAQTLWEETLTMQKLRNGVVHRGEAASSADAKKAIEIAATIVETLFPAVVSKLGLQTDAQLKVLLRKPLTARSTV